MTPERLAKIEALAEATTPGPWKWEAEDHSMASLFGPQGEIDHVITLTICRSCQAHAVISTGTENPGWEWGRCYSPQQSDADFIAQSKQIVPELIAYIRELEHRLGYDHGRNPDEPNPRLITEIEVTG